MRFTRLPLAMAALAAPFALVSCGDPAPLYIDQAWVRLNPNGQGPAAGYMTIHGGEQPVKLLRVTSEGAMRIEMHESIEENGMMKMKAIEAVEIPAKGEVKFAPGGKHLMVFDINPAIVENGKMSMTLLFSDGQRLIVDAPIQKGGSGEAKDQMSNMATPANSAGAMGGHEGH
ncbi:MAG: copper chaperone PCu(A)C [Sphingomonadales bacterium]|nr:MAG: copper chaperone PCu(A)C [Sphingomonadales bacterium]TNF03829.1 MAG: copper chaperone PCu(A)C [Sphingomonadales bacterium]